MFLRFFSLKPTRKNLIIFGLPSSGKTSIIYFFKLGYLITTVRTFLINEECFTITLKTDKDNFEEKKFKVKFFEVGSDCSFNLIKEYSEISNDLIYIVDSSQKGSLREARDDFIRIIYDFRFIYRRCKFLIFLNKQDSNGCLKSEEIINYFSLPKELLFRCKFISCSTLSGEGLKEGLDWLLNSNVFLNKTDVNYENKRIYY
ncbi:ADP-ribosylation factor, putative [Plasmodium gallinaceum]|uniref:ADP-ribosylation factor, putative n=1 Tax=Plasmodium gallinaceum TaxID=5849 RepID=A0A1J1GYL9_PLAGA|nr:ADP-ribosylation factor, putative [Plasmodium gallinaceum]CRG97552.1 ADP-ribosylation factor, putative [Plasmodium gallinaceum]